MQKGANLLSGILLSLIIYAFAILISKILSFETEFIPNSFVTHSTMLLLSVLVIIYLNKKSLISFQFKKVKIKYYLYGTLIALAGFIIANVIASIILSVFGFDLNPSGKGHTGIAGLSSAQFFVFIFIYASICEEFLFRGFMQNFLQPLKTIGFRISKSVFISLPVILSGIFFGLGHLILLNTETSGPVIFRVVIMTWIGGTIAGYFQEKHQNIIPAIIVHMTLNLPGLILSFIM